MSAPMGKDEFSRGWEAGRQALDLTTHRKARTAHDALLADGRNAEADALWAEIARLQGIVCYACEASMEAHQARQDAEARIASLGAGIGRLADEWEQWATSYKTSTGDPLQADVFDRATELRGLLRGEGEA